MQLTLMNPFGMWALTAVAAVLAIHFLQRKRRQLEISTLFLLPSARVEANAGSVWTRLRNSANLWLQLLAAVLFALALAEPTLTPRKSQQTVAVILENRVSMAVFADARDATLRHNLGTIAGEADHTHWLLIDSSTGGRPLYEGSDLQGLLSAAARWSPSGLNSNLERTVAVVSQRLGGTTGGRTIVVTDHSVALPPGVASIGVGNPTDNAGFLTHEVRRGENGTLRWRAWVRNYSDQPVTRQWRIELPDGEASPSQPIHIPANAAGIIEGAFPAATARIVVALDADALPNDNRLYLQRPLRPPLAIGYNPADPLAPFFQRLISSIPNVTRATDGADLVLRSSTAAQATGPQPAVIFITPAEYEAAATLLHPTVSSDHPLVRGLSWDGLLSGPTIAPSTAADTALAWRGEGVPLLLRHTGLHHDLVINFDLNRSNADRLPAFIALLHRYAETVRNHLPQPVADNWSTGQLLDLHYDGGATSLQRISSAPGEKKPVIVTTPAAAIGTLRAPDHPGFFSIEANNSTIASGGAQFSMVAQADLRNCSSWQDFSGFEKAPIASAAAPRTSLVPLLLLGLIGALFGTWKTAEAGQ